MSELFSMSFNEILIISALILILIDIFFASDIPTHIAYLILTFTIAKEIELALLYQILFGILIWFGLVIFHYTVWRKVLEKINDRFISPSHHKGGLDALIGKTGIIKEIDGKKFVSINEELYSFKPEIDSEEFTNGQIVEIKNYESNTLIIV